MPLRIGLLTDCYPPSVGGIEHYVYSLARGLAQQGHLVDVVTHEPPGASRSRCAVRAESEPLGDGWLTTYRFSGLVLRWGGGDPMLDPRLPSHLVELMAARRYDIVHGHSLASWLVLAGLVAARRLGIPSVITRHSMTRRPQRPPLVSQLLLSLELRLARGCADAIMSVSEAAADELPDGRRRYVMPGAVDAETWRPDPETRARMRAELGYGPDDLVIGALSRMVPSKGWLDLPEIAAEVVRAAPQARFLAVGDGPVRQQLERRLDELSLRPFFTLPGAKPWSEGRDYMSAMDIFCFPSHTEAWGIALLEAMACAKPCVARRSPGTQEIVAPGAGYLVDSNDEILASLRQLIADPSLRERLGASARQHVEQRYAWPVMASKIARAYGEIIHGTARPLAYRRKGTATVQR
ncbi:MAG: glycosyltransferase family 4 protein [Chloroflexi bacterium]|nr:glycosyltransferase family 4 protein [Chloroflexota bacterium]